MAPEEKRAMKAACVQAAATLIAARDSGKEIEVEEFIKLAALLYVRVVTTDWQEPRVTSAILEQTR